MLRAAYAQYAPVLVESSFPLRKHHQKGVDDIPKQYTSPKANNT
jgi:hypothetical protein